MSRNYFIPFPDEPLHWIQALAMHPCKVVNVKDPTGSGMVKVECAGLFGKEASNWTPFGQAVGSDQEDRGHTGLWCPAQPGMGGVLYFTAGDYTRPGVAAFGPSMKAKGEAESA